MSKLDKITIKGFKSIKSLKEFPLKNCNIFIGANGSGKSNFINFFALLRLILAKITKTTDVKDFKEFIAEEGGCNTFLYNGSKVTREIYCKFDTKIFTSSFNLNPNTDENFEIINRGDVSWISLNSGSDAVIQNIIDFKNDIAVYHFHDTSKFSPLRKSEYILDNAYLRPDGANLAPYLCMLKKNHPNAYKKILNTIRMVTPFFDEFIFTSKIEDNVWLGWRQKGSNYPLKPSQFSDGTLRFIALTTALLQPNPPALILIDEPELGLHPDAITLLAEMIQSASLKTQILVSTQSPALVDCFAPEEVVVVGRENGASTFTRLDSEQLKSWLTEYSLGELWRRNIIAGSPSYE